LIRRHVVAGAVRLAGDKFAVLAKFLTQQGVVMVECSDDGGRGVEVV